MPRRRRRHPRAKRIVWRQLARAQRKRRLIEVKNRIRNSAAYFRGLFHTSDSLSPGRGWIDLVFVSRKRPGDYYNVTLQTAFCEFSEALNDLAWEALDPALKGHGPTPQMAAAMSEARARLINEQAFSSHERFELDFSYRAGIGLHATVNEPYLSPEAVERFVNAFLDGGEAQWRSDAPLSWPASALSDDMFVNPVGADPAEEDWAQALLARNKALDERLALEALRDPASLSPKGKTPSLAL